MMHKWRASLLTFLLIGALGLVFLTTGAAIAACPDSITNYWKLDETTPGTYVDFINDNDGTGAVNPTAAAGQVNGAQQFNGTDQGIDVPADPSFDWASTHSFSIELWIRRNGAAGGNQVAIGRDDGDPLNSLHWWVGISGGTKAFFNLGDNDGGSVSIIGDTDITDDDWHHVVAVRDRSLGANGQLLLYVDGAPDATEVDAAYNAGFDSMAATLTIGYLSLAPGFHFGGWLDEVALYDRALTGAEISKHHTDGLAGKGIDYVEPGNGDNGGGGGGGGGCFIATAAK